MCPTQCYSIAPAKRLPQHYKAQLEKEHSLNDLDEIHCCAIENIDAECIFTVPAPLSAKLFEQMGTITYAHQSIPLIHNTMQNAADGIAVMTIAMTADFINIALCSGGNYDYKTFNVGAPQDMIYYILLVIKQLEVDSNNLKILVAAEMENSYQAELDSFFDNILRVKVQESYCAAGLHSYVNPNFDLLFMLQQCG